MLQYNRHAIRNLRQSKGLSLELFARNIGSGKNRQHVFQWEQGIRTPTINSLLQIINAYNVPLEIFFVQDGHHGNHINNQRRPYEQ